MMVKWAGAGMLVAALLASAPASAQFFFQSKDMRGTSVTGVEKGIMEPLPGATPAEQRAGLAWTMRAALNVAALQCQFEPTLLTVDNYNAVLKDHSVELKSAFDTLSAYFNRTAKGKGKAGGQGALDQFGTRTYANVTTVYAQINFCQAASSIGRDAVFTPRGSFGTLAQDRMRELRNAMVPAGEQMFSRYIGYDGNRLAFPRLDAICWDKKMRWQEKKCGVQNWPPAPTSLASR